MTLRTLGLGFFLLAAAAALAASAFHTSGPTSPAKDPAGACCPEPNCGDEPPACCDNPPPGCCDDQCPGGACPPACCTL